MKDGFRGRRGLGRLLRVGGGNGERRAADELLDAARSAAVIAVVGHIHVVGNRVNGDAANVSETFEAAFGPTELGDQAALGVI